MDSTTAPLNAEQKFVAAVAFNDLDLVRKLLPVYFDRQTCQHFRKPLLHCLVERKDDMMELILGEVSSLQDQNDKD
jgi:hypothetical protein